MLQKSAQRISVFCTLRIIKPLKNKKKSGKLFKYLHVKIIYDKKKSLFVLKILISRSAPTQSVNKKRVVN